jgi:RimJ/RimL family protein N-acetyltransferase
MAFVDVLSEEVVETLDEQSLRMLKLEDIEQVKGILELYADIDVPREHIAVFQQHLLQRSDSWFVEVVDTGLIWLTNILPEFKADFNVIFWDRSFGADRRMLCRHVIATAIAEFDLTRVQSFTPVTNATLAEVALRKIGFVKEGVLRKAWRDKEDCDLIVFGLLREEAVAWPVVEALKVKYADKLLG